MTSRDPVENSAPTGHQITTRSYTEGLRHLRGHSQVDGRRFRSADLRRYLLGDQPPAVDLAAKVDELLAAHLESVRLLGILVAATTTTQIGRAS